MPDFDVEGARKAGYSNQEILSHFTQSRKFDIDSAKTSGYSDDDIIGYLSSTKPKQEVGIRPGSAFESVKNKFHQLATDPIGTLTENQMPGTSGGGSTLTNFMLGGAAAGEIPGAARVGAAAKALVAPKAGGRISRVVEAFKAGGKTAEEATTPFNVKTAEFGEGPAKAPAKPTETKPEPAKAPEKTSRANRGDPKKQQRSDTIKDLHRHAKAIPLAEQAVKDGVTSKDLLALPPDAKVEFMKRIGLEGRSEETWRTFIGHVQRLEKSK